MEASFTLNLPLLCFFLSWMPTNSLQQIISFQIYNLSTNDQNKVFINYLIKNQSLWKCLFMLRMLRNLQSLCSSLGRSSLNSYLDASRLHSYATLTTCPIWKMGKARLLKGYWCLGCLGLKGIGILIKMDAHV